jgi:hypothetical protein
MLLTFQVPNLISVFFSLGRLSKEPVQARGFLLSFATNIFFLQWGVVSPTLNPHAGGPPLVSCPRLLIPYICNYLPKLEDVSSILKLRTRHALVTRDPPNMGIFPSRNPNSKMSR